MLYALIILLFAPWTYNLDEIKYCVLYTVGPLLLASVALVADPLQLRLRRAPWLPWLFAFGIAGFLSLAVSQFRWIGWLTQLQFIAWAGLFTSLALCMRSQRALRNGLAVFLGVALLQELLALFHYCGGIEWLQTVLYPEPPPTPTRFFTLLFTFSQTRNLFGTILNEDFYAAYLLTVVPTAVGALFYYRKMPWRLVAFTVALLGAVSIFLTLSKDSLLAIGLAMLVFALLILPREWGKFLGRRETWIGVAAAAAIGGILAFLILPRILIELQTFATAFTSRGIIYRGALRIFADAPVFGMGPGTFRIYFAQVRDADYFLHEISNVTMYAHNLYLDVLAEQGLLGFIAFAGFLVALFLQGWRAFVEARQNGDPTGWLHAGFLAGMSAIAVQNFFSPVSRWAVGSAIFYGFLGLAAGAFSLTLDRHRKAEAATTAKGGRLSALLPVWLTGSAVRNVCVAAACVLFVLSARHAWNHWQSARYYEQGMTALGSGQYTHAIADFERAIDADPYLVSSYYKLGHAIHARAVRQARTLAELEDASERALAVYERLEQLWPRYAEVAYNMALVNRALYSRSMDLLRQERERANPDPDELQQRAAETLAFLDRALDAARFFRRQSIKASAHEIIGDVFYDRGMFFRDYGDLVAASENPVELFEQSLAEYRLAEDAYRREIAEGIVGSTEQDLLQLREARLDALIALEEWDAAMTLAEEIYREKPYDDELASRILKIYITGLLDPARALNAAERFVEDDPLNPLRRLDLLDTALALGAEAKVLQEAAELKRLIRRIGRDNPNYPTDHYVSLVEEIEAEAKRRQNH